MDARGLLGRTGLLVVGVTLTACGQASVDSGAGGGGDSGGGNGTDTTPPTVVSRTPAPDATDVATDLVVEVVFSEALDCATATGASVVLFGVAGTVQCNQNTVQLTPGAALSDNQTYTATVTSDVTDAAGNGLAADVIWSFTTGDFTPPPPPTADNPAPPAQTTRASITVGGSKQAGSSVRVDGTERIARNGDTTWSSTFDLPTVGSHSFSLTSEDAAGNVSTSSTDFTVERLSSAATVDPPTVDPVVTPTTVGRQVLTGTKPADASVWRDGSAVLVPESPATTWSALVTLQPGGNSFDLTARDAAANVSPAVPVSITYNEPARLPAGEVQIELEFQDLWNRIGDELGVGSSCCAHINHFSPDIWIEGPLTYSGDASSFTVEPCRYDAANAQRLHTRYAGTINRTMERECLLSSPPAWCTDANGPLHENGWWQYPNYLIPNLMAALIEAGLWDPVRNPTIAYPIPVDVDRRTVAGLTPFPTAGAGGCTSSLWFWDPSCGTGGCCRPRMMYGTVIDGTTEASTRPLWDDLWSPYEYSMPYDDSITGAELGAWSAPRTITWDLTDATGQRIRPGPYLLTIALTTDRGNASVPQWGDVLATDAETCWDDPSHDTTGTRRAEGVLFFDGSTGFEVYWREKGPLERVDACQTNNDNNTRCSCGSRTAFPCPYEPVSAYDPGLPADQQEAVVYLRADAFTNPGDGQPYPVRVRYCPTGSCP